MPVLRELHITASVCACDYTVIICIAVGPVRDWHPIVLYAAQRP